MSDIDELAARRQRGQQQPVVNTGPLFTLSSLSGHPEFRRGVEVGVAFVMLVRVLPDSYHTNCDALSEDDLKRLAEFAGYLVEFYPNSEGSLDVVFRRKP